MISKEELKALARKSGLDLYQQEKDYLLKLFLYYYYQKGEEAIFKGGTCIKYLFGLERFSEDLDFNLNRSPQKFREGVSVVLKKLEQLGIKSYFLKEELFKDAFTCEVGFWGPLYTGTEQTRNKFRIDAGKRNKVLLKPKWQLISSEYPETKKNFLVWAMDEKEILAEKILSSMKRSKGRDIYDVWFLSKAGIKLNLNLLERKIKEEKVKVDIKNIISEEEYHRDISKLTNKVIPYEQVRKEIELLINRFKKRG